LVAAFGLGHVLLVLLLLLLAADRLVEQDGADADADSHASTPASSTTTAMATVILTRRGALRI